MNKTSYTLKNGLKVVLVDTEAFPSITTLLLVGSGSRYETPKNNGIAHFFEHMVFKGTKSYPSTKAISVAVDSMGGMMNAFTSKDYTGYYIKAPSEHSSKVLHIISELMQTPILDKEEIEREKGVILEEINMYEDNPARDIFDVFEEVLYPNTHLGMPIIGTKETVSSFKREDFVKYIHGLYHPSNAVLVIAGGLYTNGKSLASYKKDIKKYFETWSDAQVKSFTPVHIKQKKPVIYVKHKKTEQAHFCLGFRAFDFMDKRKHQLSVLSALLGGGMSSRLFLEVRERRGLCYYIRTFPDLYHDTGAIVTNAGVSTSVEQIREACKVIMDQHQQLASILVDATELEKAKSLLKGNLVLSLEDTYDVAHFYGKRLLHEQELKDPDGLLKAIDAVSAPEVRTLAQELFTPERLTMALIGPLKEEDFEGIFEN